MSGQVTGQGLSDGEQERIYNEQYEWARRMRGLQEATEVLAATGLEEINQGWIRNLPAPAAELEQGGDVVRRSLAGLEESV